MINDIYLELPVHMERSLFADDGAIWKRGRHCEFRNGVTRNHQELLYENVFTNSISKQGRNITYMWVPAHMGIQGNEKVDRLQKRTC